MSLPKSYHSADDKKDKILVFKGVSNNITLEDFKHLLDLNKVTHAEAERMKSKRTGKDLPFIKIKIDDPKQAEALISGGLICQKTGIIFKVEKFRITPSIQQCFKCQGFAHEAQNCTKKQKCVVCGEAHSHKDCPKRNKKAPKCTNCRGPHVANYRGCLAYKDQAFRQHVVKNQISYPFIVKQASPPPPSNTFNFRAEQIVSLVTNVVLQIAQPQLCTKTLPEKQVQAKSDLSKQIAETAKKCLGVNISGKDVSESIISRPAPPSPAPFVFSSTLVEKKKAPLFKASMVLNKATPSLVTPSSNSTKSTKTPSLAPQCMQVFLQTITTTTQYIHQTITKQTIHLECLSTPRRLVSILGRVETIGMNIVFWNCQGLRPKRKELQNYLLENQIDILALNETFLKPNLNFTFQIMTYTKMTD